MENGTGNDDRPEEGTMAGHEYNQESGNDSRHAEASTSADMKSPGQKRTASGGILSRFFSRPDSEDGSVTKDNTLKPKTSKDNISTSRAERRWGEDGHVNSPSRAERKWGDGSASAAPAKKDEQDAKHSNTTRKRKGSLRKTALLGGKRFGSEGRERRNSLLQRSPQKLGDSPGPYAQADSSSSSIDVPGHIAPPKQAPAQALKPQYSYESIGNDSISTASSASSTWAPEPAAVTTARLALLTSHAASRSIDSNNTNSTTLSSPVDLKSPTSTSQTSRSSYPSTASDDEPLTFDRPTALQHPSSTKSRPDGTSSSYFPSAHLPLPSHETRPRSRRPKKRNRSSPLTHTPSLPAPDPPSYASTASYGWLLLALTWIVFTVGMGSCLEIWSWAWDVGETPYAPPELEDDPTLPIVGYYPCLIVLTVGVVAWVWITVAWVGMKYFRHARVEV